MTNPVQIHEPSPSRTGSPSRGHLAVVDPAGGDPGSPTPSERQEVYLAALRRGNLPRGQVTRWAKAWGLVPSTVSEELATARTALDASREAPAAKVLAHELVIQAAELADNVRRLAAQAIKSANEGGEAGLRKAKGYETGAKILATAATLKLKVAGELRQLHGLKPPDGSVPPAAPPPALTDAALRGGY